MHKKHQIVQKKYKDLLTLLDFGYTGAMSFCCPENICSIETNSLQLPSFGCGDILASAKLQQGEVVLDLGCGCGVDSIRAAKILLQKNGELEKQQDKSDKHIHQTQQAIDSINIVDALDITMINNNIINDNSINKDVIRKDVIAIDMLPEMIERANKEARAQHIDNIEFINAYMEELPLQDNSVDVVISNCVINLCPDKELVFKEAYRVIKKSVDSLHNTSRVLFSDIISEAQLEDFQDSNMHTELWASCMGGVITKNNYISLMEKAGFCDIEILSFQKLSKENIEAVLPKSFHEFKEIHGLNLFKMLIRAFV